MVSGMKNGFKLIRNGSLLVLSLGITLYLTSCATAPDLPYYKKSPQAYSFDYQSNAPFSQYLADTKNYLKQNRVFFDTSKQDEELDMVAPFEWKPAASCSHTEKRGILMIHGLSDTAFVMKDLAKELNKRCLLVRTIVLPGHGTRPKDLIDVDYSDWVEAVDYGINSLKAEVDQVFIAGFSLGGLLSTNALLKHKDIKGAVLIAPALGVNMPMLTWNTTWLRHIKDWADIDPPTQAPRYQAMPMNGLAQTYLLTQHVSAKLKKHNHIKTPVLLIQSMEDVAVQPVLNVRLFKKYMTHPKSKALIYSGNTTSVRPFSGLKRINSYLPKQKIINFSHLSLPYAPENPVFGTNGSYKACGQNVGLVPAKQANDCLQSDDNWMGEFGSEDEEKFYPFQRITFNPLFDSMAEQIDDYLKTL